MTAAPPPAAVHAEDELPAAAVRTMLTAPSRGTLLTRLGITGEDAAELAPLADAAAADEEVLAEVTAVANELRAGAGLEVPALDLAARKEEHDALQQRLAPGEGLVPILAFLVSTSTVRAWHAARGLSPEQSWHVLADLGQQMRVHRAGTGRLGLHQLNWVTGNWAGRLVHLGRLQFDLSRRRVARLEIGAERTAEDEPMRWVLGTHIPATGPLDPAEVEDSFGHEFTCDSWLLSEELAEITGADSNLARFAGLWQVLTPSRMDDAALFFVFGLRPPVDPASLPRRTRLERGVAERLADGRGWTGGTGRLLR